MGQASGSFGSQARPGRLPGCPEEMPTGNPEKTRIGRTPVKLFLSTQRWKPEYEGRFDGVFLPHRLPFGAVKPLRPEARIVTVSVFGDTLGIRQDPDRAAVAVTGERAVIKENVYDGFAWSWVCPNHPEHWHQILELLHTIPADRTVLLSDFQFPNERYCHCSRCVADRERRGAQDLAAWRVQVLRERFQEIRAATCARLALTLPPDPFGLRHRYGVDPAFLEGQVEFLMFPVYSLDYRLAYWMDILVPALLHTFRRFRVVVELYFVEPCVPELAKALFTVAKYEPWGIAFYDLTDKHLELARYFRENERIQGILERVHHPGFHQLVQRIRSWETEG